MVKKTEAKLTPTTKAAKKAKVLGKRLSLIHI